MPWERPLTRRDVLVKGALAGGMLAAGGAPTGGAYARPTAVLTLAPIELVHTGGGALEEARS